MRLPTYSVFSLLVLFDCGGDTAITPPDGGTDAQAPDVQQPADTSVPVDTGTFDDTGVDTGVVDTGVDAGTPDPSAIFGSKLVLWLDADEASTVVTDADASNRVTAWKDKSSFANDAKAMYSGTGHIDVTKLAVNGRTALKLPGTYTNGGLFNVTDTISLQFGTGDLMVVFVAAYNNTPGTDEYGGRGVLWAKQSGGWPYWGANMAANAYSAPKPDGGTYGADSVIYAGIKSFADGNNSGAWTVKNGWNDGNFHAFAGRKDVTGKLMYVRADGNETSSVVPIDTTTSLSAFGADVQLGGYSTGSNCCFSPLKGYLAEVIAVKGSSGTSSELSQLGAYIKAKYNLTL